MNALSLVARVQRRIPSYDFSEYLDETNAAYKECWDYICQLDDSYFTDTKIVTVNVQGAEFDFLYNSNGNLSAAISNRYFQIDRIRILAPGVANWVSASPRGWNDPDILVMESQTPQPVAVSGPYLYTVFAKGSVLFGRPLAVGTQIELVYSFIFMPLTVVSNGTITSTGASIAGTSTSFTQLLPADYQAGFPGNDQDTDVGIELVLPGNQTYRVKTLTSDTALTTINSISPAVTAATYQLAMVPDIPEGHHNVIATLATRNVALYPARDFQLFNAQAALAKIELDAMRDSVMTRQRQEPARRRRFPQSVLRYFTPSITR